MIVKVQSPIMPPDAPILVYDKAREWQGTFEPRQLPDHVKKAVAETRKAYFRATMVGTNIRFGSQVPQQDW